jgi:hypothetical protein
MHREKLLSDLERFLSSQRSLLRGLSNNDLSSFTARYLRDLQENRATWIQRVANDLEGALQQEVTALVGEAIRVRAFQLPTLEIQNAAPTFTPPKMDESTGFLPGLFGGIVGTIFGGPLVGAGVAFLTRKIFGSDDGNQDHSTYAAYRIECEAFLEQSKSSVRQDVENLLQGMHTGWVPQFFEPLQAEIERQSKRVEDTQADLGKGEQERVERFQALQAERRPLAAMVERTESFLAHLRLAGTEPTFMSNPIPG